MKLYGARLCGTYPVSRSVWARGLKLYWFDFAVTEEESRSVWARGLKQAAAVGEITKACVALCMGAWIETGKTFGLEKMDPACRALYGRVD